MKRFGLLLAVFTVVVSVGGWAFVQEAQPKPMEYDRADWPRNDCFRRVAQRT